VGAWRAAALAAEFGFSVVGSMVGGIIAGRLLDQWLGTAPAFFLIGLFCGLLFSIYLMYIIYRLQVAPRPSASATSVPDRPTSPPDSVS
jgi:F0F1-type ATP synthase assembly protein I